MKWTERQLGRHLNLRDLNVLMTIARCGSMGKAAAQLSVSQPAISKVVADLEHALGVRLLDRTQRGAEPTVYGRALLDGGLNAFDQLKQAVKQIEFLADPTAGEVRVGSTVIVASSFIATTVDHLSRQYPRITVHLLAAEAAMIYHALEERDVEVVIAGIFRLDGGRQFERGSPLRRSFRGCSRCAESMEPAPPHKTCRFDE